LRSPCIRPLCINTEPAAVTKTSGSSYYGDTAMRLRCLPAVLCLLCLLAPCAAGGGDAHPLPFVAASRRVPAAQRRRLKRLKRLKRWMERCSWPNHAAPGSFLLVSVASTVPSISGYCTFYFWVLYLLFLGTVPSISGLSVASNLSTALPAAFDTVLLMPALIFVIKGSL
jgi:hypothetical protein